MTFARRLFTFAGVYGLLVLTPLLFLEDLIGKRFPPPPNHPELYYGLIGLALAWQLVYLLIGRDPERYRPIMLCGAFGKFSYGVTCAVLWARGRAELATFLLASPDLVFAALFVLAYRRTAGPTRSAMPDSRSPTT